MTTNPNVDIASPDPEGARVKHIDDIKAEHEAIQKAKAAEIERARERTKALLEDAYPVEMSEQDEDNLIGAAEVGVADIPIVAEAAEDVDKIVAEAAKKQGLREGGATDEDYMVTDGDDEYFASSPPPKELEELRKRQAAETAPEMPAIDHSAPTQVGPAPTNPDKPAPPSN